MSSMWIDVALVIIVFSNFALLGGTRLPACIHRIALQGALLGVLTLLLHESGGSWHAIALTLLATAIKALLFPWLLSRAVREVSARREVSAFVSQSLSLLTGLVLLGIAMWLASKLPNTTANTHHLVLPVGFFGLFCGFFLIVARRFALMQVIGYLALENGIYLLGLGLLHHTPYLLELGVLFDVLLSVLVMGTTIFQMNRTLDHIEADRLATLKD